MEVVDAHQHVGDLSNALGDREEREVTVSPEEEMRNRVRGMAETGVDWAVIQPSHGYLKSEGIKDTMRANDGMAEYRRRDPARFPIALGTVEPLHGERSLEEIDRVKQELGLNGLSWHHRFQGCFIDNKWMRPILRRMADLKLVPFVHTNAESGLEAHWRLQKLARQFPELTFLALDAFFTHERSTQLMDTADQSPNVLWDLGGPASYIPVETWVRRHGSQNLTFSRGAGYSSTGPAKRPRLLDAILESNLKEEDKANILGRNVRRLFGMPLEG